MSPDRPPALVADDEPSVRSILTIYLGAAYAVTAVADGAAAARALLADPALAGTGPPMLNSPRIWVRVDRVPFRERDRNWARREYKKSP